MTSPAHPDHDDPPRVMERHDVRRLLAVVMSYDNRNPGDANVEAWLEAATLGRWTFPEARMAVAAHFQRSTEWLMPAHVGALIRSWRADASHRYTPPEPRVLASEDTRSQAVASFRAHQDEVRRRRREESDRAAS